MTFPGMRSDHRAALLSPMLSIAIVLSGIIHVVLGLTRPLLVTFDGVGYIDMANMIGTERFPEQWHALRTPLYPLALKVVFAVFGQTGYAALALNVVIGFFAVLLTGLTVALLCGPVAGSVSLIALSLYPTVVTFQHALLTESGTFFFVALILLAVAIQPESKTGQRWRVAVLAFALGAGYLWRQNVGYMAPFVCLGLWVLPPRFRERRQTRLVHAAVLVLVPVSAAVLWGRVIDQRETRAVVISYGMAKQMLLPREDPLFAGAPPQMYEEAMAASLTEQGTFYSGLVEGPCEGILRQIRSRVSTAQLPFFFIRSVVEYPGRYLAGVFRTWMAYAGAAVKEDELYMFAVSVLAPGDRGGLISRGPAQIPNIERDFAIARVDTPLSRFVWTVRPTYQWLTFIALFVSVCGAVSGLVLRDYRLLIVSLLPIAYLTPSALFLGSVPRYAVPVHPFMLANLIFVTMLLARKAQDSRRTTPPVEAIPAVVTAGKPARVKKRSKPAAKKQVR